MIVSARMAAECWSLLRQFARISDEKWDEEAMLRPEGRTEAEINQAFRAAAKYTHPDTGGDAAQYALVDRAKAAMLEYAKRAAPAATPPHGGVRECPRCKGARHIMLQRGIRQMRMQCPTCRGHGELDEEKPETGDML